jgi:hypothetical protein
MQDVKGTASEMEAGRVHQAQASAASASASRQRITADSFRLLTARLKSKDPIPDLMVPPPVAAEQLVIEPRTWVEPEPEIIEQPVTQEVQAPVTSRQSSFGLPSEFALPDFIPLNEVETARSYHQPEPEPVAPEVAETPDPVADTAETYVAAESGEELPAPEVPAETPEPIARNHAWPNFPAFGEPLVHEQLLDEPVAPIEAATVESLTPDAQPVKEYVEPAPETVPEVEAEPVVEAFLAEPALEAQPEPEVTVAPEPAPAPEPAVESEPEPVPEPAPATSLAGVISAAKAARTPSALAEKVVDALIKTVTEAVYAKPSASERAAFLRDIAALVEKSEATAPEIETEIPAPGFEAAPAEDIAAAPEVPAPPPVEQPAEIKDAIASKLGAASQILRKAKSEDPFATTPAKFETTRIEESREADEDTGTLAMSLLDMMAGGSASSQPQERALAADTLLRLVPRIPSKQLLSIAERVAIMEAPPSLLVAKLIRDHRHEIAAPLLERCMHITDQDLATATAEGDVHKLRMIARRRIISPTLSDQLIDRGDTSVILTLVRNPGVSLNHDSFFRLADHAIEHQAVLAPLATRADLPAPVAFELFWHVPLELRRFLLSRFLTDSENLNRILKITLATQAAGDGAANAEQKFPPQEKLDEALAHVVKGELEQGAQILADAAGLAPETVLRVLADAEGEPVAVLLKTLGFQRAKFSDAIAAMQNAEISLIRPGRKIDELQNVFDTLSFNKARILLTYWDWYVRKAGPYAPHN